jgi:hypothetical protein
LADQAGEIQHIGDSLQECSGKRQGLLVVRACVLPAAVNPAASSNLWDGATVKLTSWDS